MLLQARAGSHFSSWRIEAWTRPTRMRPEEGIGRESIQAPCMPTAHTRMTSPDAAPARAFGARARARNARTALEAATTTDTAYTAPYWAIWMKGRFECWL